MLATPDGNYRRDAVNRKNIPMFRSALQRRNLPITWSEDRGVNVWLRRIKIDQPNCYCWTSWSEMLCVSSVAPVACTSEWMCTGFLTVSYIPRTTSWTFIRCRAGKTQS